MLVIDFFNKAVKNFKISHHRSFKKRYLSCEIILYKTLTLPKAFPSDDNTITVFNSRNTT